MRRFFSFVAGAACGALVGVAFALLLAPASGAEIRQKTIERLAALGEEIRASYEERAAQLEAELDLLRHGGGRV